MEPIVVGWSGGLGSWSMNVNVNVNVIANEKKVDTLGVHLVFLRTFRGMFVNCFSPSAAEVQA